MVKKQSMVWRPWHVCINAGPTAHYWQSLMAVTNPNKSASLVQWMKVARKFVYPEEGNCPVLCTQSEVADMLYMQATLDLLYSDQDNSTI